MADMSSNVQDSPFQIVSSLDFPFVGTCRLILDLRFLQAESSKHLGRISIKLYSNGCLPEIDQMMQMEGRGNEEERKRGKTRGYEEDGRQREGGQRREGVSPAAVLRCSPSTN